MHLCANSFLFVFFKNSIIQVVSVLCILCCIENKRHNILFIGNIKII